MTKDGRKAWLPHEADLVTKDNSQGILRKIIVNGEGALRGNMFQNIPSRKFTAEYKRRELSLCGPAGNYICNLMAGA